MNTYNVIEFTADGKRAWVYLQFETNDGEKRRTVFAYVNRVTTTSKGKSITYYDNFGIMRTVFLSTKKFTFFEDVDRD